MKKEFLHIIENHQGIIHKVCSIYRNTKEDQEDLFQEIVFQLWKSFPSFRKEAKITTWMYRIALNTALVAFRQRSPKITYGENYPELPFEPGSGKELHDWLLEVIRTLPDVDKALISLYLEGYAYHEIAEILGMRENNVGVRLYRIKDKLKKIVQHGN